MTNGDDGEGRGAARDSLAAPGLLGIRNLGLNMVVSRVQVDLLLPYRRTVSRAQSIARPGWIIWKLRTFFGAVPASLIGYVISDPV